MEEVDFLLLAGFGERGFIGFQDLHFFLDRIEWHQLSTLNSTRPNLLNDGFNASISIVFASQLTENIYEISMLFLHLLMVASALFGFSGGDEAFHGLEDLVHSSEVFVKKMVGVQLEEPMISLIFFNFPVSPFLATLHGFIHLSFLLLFPGCGVTGGGVFPVYFYISEGSVFGHCSGGFSNQVTKDVIT